MIVNGVDVTVDKALELTKVDEHFLKRRENGILLNDYQIAVLNRNNIDYHKYNSLSSLLFEIEEYLNVYKDEELEEVSKQLAEIHYYMETNK